MSQRAKLDEEQKGQLIVMEKFTKRKLLPYDSNRRKLVFHDDCELVPSETGGWKIIDNGKETQLPLESNWVISFKNYDHIVITTIPYFNLLEGEWVVLYYWNSTVAKANVYCIGKEELVECDAKEISERLKKKCKKDEKYGRKWAKAYRKARGDDDDDDEENIMRGLNSGNGDKFGF